MRFKPHHVSKGVKRRQSISRRNARCRWARPRRLACEALEQRWLLSVDTDFIGLDLLRAAWPSIAGSGQTIAVIDSGINVNHPELNIWTNPGEIPDNGTDDDANGYVDDVHGYDFSNDDPEDRDPLELEDPHGTHMAGIIASTDATYPGVAGGGAIIALDVLASSTSEQHRPEIGFFRVPVPRSRTLAQRYSYVGNDTMDPFESHQEAISLTFWVVLAGGAVLGYIAIRIVFGIIRKRRK